jgi:hypothetical protein
MAQQKLARKILKEIALYPSDGVEVLNKLQEIIKTTFNGKLPSSTEEFDNLYKQLDAKPEEPPSSTPPPSSDPAPPLLPPETQPKLSDIEIISAMEKIKNCGLSPAMKHGFTRRLLKSNGLSDQEILELMEEIQPPRTSPAKRREITPPPSENIQEEKNDPKKQKTMSSGVEEEESIDSLLQSLETTS